MRSHRFNPIIGMVLVFAINCQSATIIHADGLYSALNGKLQTNNNKKPIDTKEPKTGSYVAIKEKSEVRFNATAKMLGVTTEVPGQFKDFSISATKELDLEKSTIEVIIDAKSIDTDNARRDRHLKKSDFFDVEKFPSITFKSKKIRRLKDEQYEINGDLKIKNKVTNISFTVVAKKLSSSDDWKVTGETKLDRNTVGITYESPFYLPDVGNEIKIAFAIRMKPKQQ